MHASPGKAPVPDGCVCRCKRRDRCSSNNFAKHDYSSSLITINDAGLELRQYLVVASANSS